MYQIASIKQLWQVGPASLSNTQGNSITNHTVTLMPTTWQALVQCGKKWPRYN